MNLTRGDFAEDLTELSEGSWWYPVSGARYDAAYFDKYAGYAATPLGAKLTAARINFVRRFWDEPERLVDVGIGCGHFLQHYHGAMGYDVNPAGVTWLREHKRYFNLYHERVGAASFWDSLEHIETPGRALEMIDAMAFVSIPIFRNRGHVLQSKHFRPDEHYWYFTKEGFIDFMAEAGFDCLAVDDFEINLGREDILTFAFRRVA